MVVERYKGKRMRKVWESINIKKKKSEWAMLKKL